MEFFQSNIKLGEVFVQLLAFVIVFWTLKKFAWKPLLAALELRRERIKSDFEKIEHAKKEVEALKADYHTHLQKIEDEARTKIQHAVEEGRRIAKDIQEKARAESQATFSKAKENLELEVAKARIEMRREIGELSIRVAERVMREKMDAAKEEQKTLAIIEELEKTL